jgi:hypothetical protein
MRQTLQAQYTFSTSLMVSDAIKLSEHTKTYAMCTLPNLFDNLVVRGTCL